MIVNVDNFKKVLQKATMNFSIDSVQLNVTEERIKSSMINEQRNVIVFLDVENDVFSGCREMELNFMNPSQQLIPFLNLIDDEEIDMVLKEEKIILKSGRQKSNIHFCSPTVVGTFSSKPQETENFFGMDIDNNFKDNFAKIKKIGSRFGNVYFNVKDKVFSIETSDKSNMYSNGLKFDLWDNVDIHDLVMRFDYKNIVNMMAVVNGDNNDFTMKFAYKEDQEMGMLTVANGEYSEQYYLLSREV